MTFETSERSRVRRVPQRAVYERARIEAILDEGLICHVGFVDGGRPFVIPTVYARDGEHLLVHGSRASRMLLVLATGAPACVTVTLVDGLVLARSLFHHSMNYRSVVLLGRGEEVTGEDERLRALERLAEHVVPGRWGDARDPSEKELAATMIVALRIEEASAKIRTGPPADEEEDYALPFWAGVIPVRLRIDTPQADPRLSAQTAVPDYVRAYERGRSSA